MVTWVEQARDEGAIESDARALLPDPATGAGARRSVTEITRRR